MMSSVYYIPTINANKGFTFTLQLHVYKGISFDHIIDNYISEIFTKYAWAVQKVHDKGELSDELYGILEDILNESTVLYCPSESTKNFTKEELGTYMKKYYLNQYLCQAITTSIFKDTDTDVTFDSENATITFRITNINTDKVGDIDRYIYGVQAKLRGGYFNDCIGSSTYNEGESFYLYEKQHMNIKEFIDKLREIESIRDDSRLIEDTIELYSCWGCIDYRRDNIVITPIE